MKRLFLIVGLTAALVGVVPFAAMAARPYKADRSENKKEGMPQAANVELVEKVGQIEVGGNPQARGKYKNVTLKVGNDTYRLLAGRKNKSVMSALEQLAGHEVSVKGRLLPADAKHPMPAIIVQSFTEQSAAQAGAASGTVVTPVETTTSASTTSNK